MNIEPQRAPVKPRVHSDDGGSVPLENEILPLLHHDASGVIALLGGTGSGRTTALNHLACLIPAESNTLLVDNAIKFGEPKKPGIVVYTGERPLDEFKHLAIFRLAPWTNDDLIEYLL